jgi:hypothetical protein
MRAPGARLCRLTDVNAHTNSITAAMSGINRQFTDPPTVEKLVSESLISKKPDRKL